MIRKDAQDIGRLFAEGTPIDAAVQRAARQALRRHRRARQNMPEWRDGRVVWVTPEEVMQRLGLTDKDLEE